MPHRLAERHKTEHISWLRAAVLGANDGIVSTASLILGVAAAGGDQDAIMVAGVAGLVAGAMSMAAGEYVSVHSQADTEKADIKKETDELQNDPAGELSELTAIYVHRGLSEDLAKQVAVQLTAFDALGSHARDELGINPNFSARPIQAALSSAASFAIGAVMPIAVAWLMPATQMIPAVAASTAVFLGLLGAVAAQTGGAPVIKGAVRVLFWGLLAMAATYLVGSLFGVSSA
jgi:VIT1/CCC1 family predicted Fe2+/Mn2+ transporter